MSFGHPGKFQLLSRLGFVTTLASLSGGQPNFARCLAVSWAGTHTFCHVQNSVCAQVLRYPILAALLHGTRAVGVSQTLRRGIFTQQGGHPIRHWAVELSSFDFILDLLRKCDRLQALQSTNLKCSRPNNETLDENDDDDSTTKNGDFISERELTFTLAICYRPSVCLSVVCLSVTFVRPTQAVQVQIFGNISTALGTLAIR